MKKTTLSLSKSFFLMVFSMFATFSLAQTAEVIVTVNWPQWSSENKVEIFAPGGVTPIQTIDNGYDGATNNSYSDTINLGNLALDDNDPAGSGYRVVVYDSYGDGWNGSGSMTITSDGINVFSFNGAFSTTGVPANTEVTDTFYFAVQNPPPAMPGVSQFDTSGNEYIEYIPGNLPIIISAPHGGVKQSGQTIGGTFYPDNDSALPDRGCGTNERDDNTDILAREIEQSIFDISGCYAHVIISNLHRSKLDPNRAQAEATCGDADALFYWNAFHGFIDDASASVVSEYGKGLYIDLHGQSHSIPRIEAGYNISSSDLNNTTPNYLNSVSGSTITNLVNTNINGYTQEELVRGPNSLGAMFATTGGAFYAAQGYAGCGATSGYRTVPSNVTGPGGTSCDDTRPYSNAYFDGDFYNNRRHGSGPAASDGQGGGGTIDGIMTEVNRRVRDLGTYNGNVYDTRPQTLVPFADDYAAVLINYIDTHYNNFAEFAYGAASYATDDADPTPTKASSAVGTFSSTAGLVIDENTGVIDLSASTPGDYTITFSAGTCGIYTSTQMVTITGSTLGIDENDTNEFSIYPNPTTGLLHIQVAEQINYIQVRNVLGQTVKTISIATDKKSIDISDLQSGSYFVTLQTKNNQILTKHIIKQ